MVCFPGVDTVVAAIDGTSSLRAILKAIDNNHRICLANKESLVAAGALVNRSLDRSRAELLPIDSEQSAIFQSIGADSRDSIRRVILTASGGPFFADVKSDLSTVTPEEALAHPTWSMGEKISIDSATLMNKALEIIEAFYLFRLREDQIDVLIHPQSIVHSLVEFIDSSMIAQLSVPDMKIPILYSLGYPDRFDSVSEGLDLGKLGKLDFYEVDTQRFPSIRLARLVLSEGGNSGAVMNSANEVAVQHFLGGQITFSEIFSVVEAVLEESDFHPIQHVEDVVATIESTRAKTVEIIKRRAHP
jgi:1-deoxy-D-xylulose-5-phosphate reductoisomerase